MRGISFQLGRQNVPGLFSKAPPAVLFSGLAKGLLSNSPIMIPA
jgi:hypothetical protein